MINDDPAVAGLGGQSFASSPSLGSQRSPASGLPAVAALVAESAGVASPESGGRLNQPAASPSAAATHPAEAHHPTQMTEERWHLIQRYKSNRAISSDPVYYTLLAIYVLFIVFGTISNALICLTVSPPRGPLGARLGRRRRRRRRQARQRRRKFAASQSRVKLVGQLDRLQRLGSQLILTLLNRTHLKLETTPAKVILKPKILSPRNLFIVNLAGSDLLLCVFTMPFSFIEISSFSWRMGKFKGTIDGGRPGGRLQAPSD